MRTASTLLIERTRTCTAKLLPNFLKDPSTPRYLPMIQQPSRTTNSTTALQQIASTSTLASHHTARTHQSSFSASLKRISSKQSTPARASPLTDTSQEPSNLGSPWIITDGVPVEDDWDICVEAERMSARNREKVSRSTHNSRMREALLVHGKGAGTRAVSDSQRR